MSLSPVLCPAVSTQSLSRQKWCFAAPRAEANKRLQPVLPLIGAYRTGKRFRVGGQLQAHRHNDFLEIRASFTATKKARQALFPKTIPRQVVSECDSETQAARLVICTVCSNCCQRGHAPACSRSASGRSSGFRFVVGSYVFARLRTRCNSDAGISNRPNSVIA